jgi:hypothetical protein
VADQTGEIVQRASILVTSAASDQPVTLRLQEGHRPSRCYDQSIDFVGEGTSAPVVGPVDGKQGRGEPVIAGRAVERSG